MAAGHDGRTLRVLLLGKTGSGKSTVGNALLGGGDRFQVRRGLMSAVTRTTWNRGVRKDITFEVTDTPGLCDTSMDKWLVYKELAKSVAVAKPGPNIILFVLRVDHRFTEELVRKNGGAVYSTEMTEEINRRVDEMMKFERDTPRRIIEEDVPKGFFESIGNVLDRAFGRINRAASELCAVM